MKTMRYLGLGFVVIAALGILAWKTPLTSDHRTTEYAFRSMENDKPVQSNEVSVTKANNTNIANHRIHGSQENAAAMADATWRDFQRSTNLRDSVANAATSNDVALAAAALNVLTYCADVSQASRGKPEDAAQKALLTFDGDKTLKRSNEEFRSAAIARARTRCSFENSSTSNTLDVSLRSRLAKALGPLSTVETSFVSQDWSAPTQMPNEVRKLFSEYPIATASRSAIYQLDAAAQRSGYESGADFAGLLAIEVALCTLGDDCRSGSLRYDRICVYFGACEGADVNAAVSTLLSDASNVRIKVSKISEQMVNISRELQSASR